MVIESSVVKSINDHIQHPIVNFLTTKTICHCKNITINNHFQFTNDHSFVVTLSLNHFLALLTTTIYSFSSNHCSAHRSC
jgi:hypothetical protein